MEFKGAGKKRPLAKEKVQVAFVWGGVEAPFRKGIFLNVLEMIQGVKSFRVAVMCDLGS